MPARRHFTIVAIIAVCAAAFVWQQAAGPAASMRFGATPVIVSQAAESIGGGDAGPAAVGELLRLVTGVFLHADAEHIVYNMVFLWAFGVLASEHLGAWWALAAFVVTGVCGMIAQVALNPESPVPVIGASGAVCGFEGLYLGLALRWRLPDPDVWPLAHPIPPLQLGAVAVLGFVWDAYSMMNHDQGIAYGAHIGGLFAGLVIALIVTSLYPTESAFARSLGRTR